MGVNLNDTTAKPEAIIDDSIPLAEVIIRPDNKVPGGTWFGNLLRSVANENSFGLLGNGDNMIPLGGSTTPREDRIASRNSKASDVEAIDPIDDVIDTRDYPPEVFDPLVVPFSINDQPYPVVPSVFESEDMFYIDNVATDGGGTPTDKPYDIKANYTSDIVLGGEALIPTGGSAPMTTKVKIMIGLGLLVMAVVAWFVLKKDKGFKKY